jgi:biotin synthase-like enzyme
VYYQVQILKYFKMSSYVCGKDCIYCKQLCFYFPNRNTNYYMEAEDIAILKFVSQRKRYKATGGVRLWKLMERKKAVPGKGALLMACL